MEFAKWTLSDRPDLRSEVDRLAVEAWPPFLLQAHIPRWEALFEEFRDTQILFCDREGRVAALGHSVPLVWDGTVGDLPKSIGGILQRALDARERGEPPNTVSAVAAIVDRAHRGQGLSYTVVEGMRALAKERGCRALIAPVRPTWKARYPLASMDRYITWKREDGAPIDPWLRVHWRLGAQTLEIIPQALTVTGTVSEWEAWTGMPLPESGRYVVPGALQPVVIDREKDLGRYDDVNVWMKHAL